MWAGVKTLFLKDGKERTEGQTTCESETAMLQKYVFFNVFLLLFVFVPVSILHKYCSANENSKPSVVFYGENNAPPCS